MTNPTQSDRSDQAAGIALRLIRQRLNLRQEDAAEIAGISERTLRRFELTQRHPSLAEAIRIAGQWGVSTEEFLLQVSQAALGLPAPQSPVVGLVERGRAYADAPPGDRLVIRDRITAGAWVVMDDYEPTRRLYNLSRDPRFPRADQWLDEVVGDSMDRAGIFDGDLVHCVDAEQIRYFPKTGDIVEVERTRFGGRDRELTVKEIEVTAAGVKLWPRSNNPRHGAPLSLTEGAPEGELELTVRIRGLVLASIRRF